MKNLRRYITVSKRIALLKNRYDPSELTKTVTSSMGTHTHIDYAAQSGLCIFPDKSC